MSVSGKSAAEKVCWASSRIVIVLAAPAGASLTDVMVTLTVPVEESGGIPLSVAV